MPRSTATQLSRASVQRRLESIGRRSLHSTRRLGWALQDFRLTREQRRGVLGRAHAGWRDHSRAEHRAFWSAWDWSAYGEEWNLSEEWKQSLIEDVLERFIPSGAAVLEIGPGGGRWTEVLVARASVLYLVDISERPLQVCRERFAAARNVEYVLSPGASFPSVPDACIDAVWSFDVFVHVAPVDQAAYLAELARVTTPGAVAVIHHADGRNRGALPSRGGWRAPMSRKLFGALASERGFEVVAQFDSWGPTGQHNLAAYGDAITVLRRSADGRDA